MTPQLANLLKEIMREVKETLFVAWPGKIHSYNSALQLAEIELQLKNPEKNIDGQYENVTLPILPSIPVCMPRAGNFFINIPVTTGTMGVVLFCDLNLSQWQALGTLTSAGDVRKHTLSGGIFLPGLNSTLDVIPIADRPDSKITIGHTGTTKIVISNNDISIETSAGTIKATFSSTGIKLENSSGDIELKATGQVDINGNFTVDP